MNNCMVCNIDLDWCTYVCPCGGSLCTHKVSESAVDEWLAAHKPHTNGEVLEHTTADGQRAWGRPVPDEVKPLY